MKTLDNKVAIITGAGSGIGKAIANLFSKEGAKVVVSDINETNGQEVVNQINDKGGNAFFIKADTSSAEDSKNLVEKTLEKYGSLHIAVNNAGIGGPQANVGECPIDGWDKVIAINLNGVFYGMRYQIPAIEKSNGGSIINIASILGSVGFPSSAAYVAAKHGVVGLSKSAALEYGTKNIRVNSVGPGFIKTPLVENNLDADTLKFLETKHAMNRLGEPNEVAELCLWLASDRSSFVTGAYYTVDGGYTAQ